VGKIACFSAFGVAVFPFQGAEMICPKCGFSQPDDIFCANCGVNLETYRRKKKKKCIFWACTGLPICALAVLLMNHFFNTADREETGAPSSEESTIQAPSQLSSSEMTTREGVSDTIDARLTAGGGSDTFPKRTAPSVEKELTAREWFERGRALDDDSQEEMRCYLQALRLERDFAAAYYRLGAIYLRQAEYDLADQAFIRFLRFASDEDKRLYDIHVYYSIAEVETLLEDTSRETSENKTIVRFRQVQGQIQIPVRINRDLTANMLLDTGAGITLLSGEMAERLGLETDTSELKRLQTIGQEIEAPLARLEIIELGGLSKNDFPIAVSDFDVADGSFDGILGMDFLGEYDMYIDNQSNSLILLAK
jgi:clan AA aspartic protease (TIGR02281 family)